MLVMDTIFMIFVNRGGILTKFENERWAMANTLVAINAHGIRVKKPLLEDTTYTS